MIVVKIELWPMGQESSSREIGRTYITKQGAESSSRRGTYDVDVCRRGTDQRPPDGSYTRQGRVEDYPRKSYNIWRLIIRALKDCFPEER